MAVKYDITFKKQVAALAQTGEHTFENISRRAHVHVETIARWTREFARPRWLIDPKKENLVRGYIDFEKTPPVIALPDTDIAADVGLTVEAVGFLRRRAGAVHNKNSLYVKKQQRQKAFRAAADDEVRRVSDLMQRWMAS